MNFWTRYRQPILIVSITTVADVLGRLLLEFDMIHVSAMEAAIFSAASIALGNAARRDMTDPPVRQTDLVLAVLLALAAVRALTWAATGSVFAANVTILLAGTGVAFVLWIRRRSPDTTRDKGRQGSGAVRES